MRRVTDEDVLAFDRDGAVCLRGAFELEWLEVLAHGVERNLTDISPLGVRYTPEGAPGGFVDDYCRWQDFAEYRRFLFESNAAEIAASLMRSSVVRLFHEHVLVKEPGTLEVTPWHHDQPYYCVDGAQLCSIWLPLDPVPLSATVRFVVGSHRWGNMFALRKFIDHGSYDRATEAFEPVPDIDASPESYEILEWALEPGDCIVFHMRTLHSAPGTRDLKTRRRAFSSRWLGDDAVFARRSFETSPPFPDVDLEPGQPMAHDRFPIVYPVP